MRPLRYAWLWLGLGLFGLGALLALALLPLAQPLPVDQGDKVLHALVFAVLTVWFLGIFHHGLALRVVAALAAYGLLIEFLQSFTTYRFADPYDVLSDAIGIAAGWLLATAGLHRWCGRVEALFGAAPP